MSYSFSVKGPEKADIINQANAELDKVQAAQPSHIEFHQVKAAIAGLVHLLPHDEKSDYSASISGSVYHPEKLRSVSVTISLSVIERAVPDAR